MSFLDSCHWTIEGKCVDRNQVAALLAECPHDPHEAVMVTVRLQNVGNWGRATPAVSAQAPVPIEGGIEMVQWAIERMVGDLLRMKARGCTEKQLEDQMDRDIAMMEVQDSAEGAGE